MQAKQSVSIHAPWEGCDLPFMRDELKAMVSIHAPWEGCDCSKKGLSRKVVMFQFTHPGKGATCALYVVYLYLTFQFTHPGKGATTHHWAVYGGAQVSIHAPWEGCDGLQIDKTKRPRRFNSRTLGRVRPLNS